MAGLWCYNPEFVGGKYLVLRRDGTVPPWLYMVLGSADPAAPAGLRGYADEAERLGMDPDYVRDVRRRADEFEEYYRNHPPGDPDAGRHRVDDPAVVERLRQARGS